MPLSEHDRVIDDQDVGKYSSKSMQPKLNTV